MSLIKFIGIFIAGVCLDGFIFPISLEAWSGANSKMLLAVAGLLLLMKDLAERNTDFFNRKFAMLSILALLVSMAGILATAVNNTNDYTYSTYIISMWVWVFAAYAVVRLIKRVHGYFSPLLLAAYVAAVGIFQSLFALGYEYVPAFTDYINGARPGFTMIYETKGRMQGLAAALDPAGIRFAASLVILAYAAVNGYREKIGVFHTSYLIFAFILITLVGNMIARTTLIGSILGLFYWLVTGARALMSSDRGMAARQVARVWRLFLPMLLIAVSYTAVRYSTDGHFRDNLRFGFEGFFSLAESGRWEVSSNEILKNMVVLPTTAKTWLIGDGYIENPSKGGDPYYVGEQYSGYYKDTDIGYLRFIFYFGIAGLGFYVAYFIYAAEISSDYFPSSRSLFILLLLLNFIVWIKVSTDIFQFFALFIAAGADPARREEDDAQTAA